jgi:Cu/Ag efflux pump CusA
MKFSHFFIHRPVFAGVLSIIIFLVGLIAMWRLPISEYPDVVPPTVVVQATYPGANPKTISETVAAPLEQAVSGVEDSLYMFSRSTTDGVMSLTVTFKLGTDIDKAQVQVQNRVAQALPKLPEEVRQLGVTTGLYLSALHPSRFSFACRAVRELSAAICHNPHRANVSAFRHHGRLAQRQRQQHIHPDWLDCARRPRVQERDSDCRVRQAKTGRGHATVQATVEACSLRLRPILMTSIAFIAGVFPLVISTGAGSEMRQAMGVAVFPGMMGVTLFGLFPTPVFYVTVMKFGWRKSSGRKSNQKRSGPVESSREPAVLDAV